MEILVKAAFSIADAVEVGEHLSGGGTAIVNLLGVSWFDRDDVVKILRANGGDPCRISEGIYLIPGKGVTVSTTL